MIKNFITKYPILVAVLLLTFIIRLGAGYVQSFSNDELSALYRLQYANFHDLLHWGIKVDGHPAFVQLFLNYYTSVVPKSEIWIRLPFIISSTLSLVFIFFSLKKIAGHFTAHMVVIILAFAGFSLQLGYFARPYAFGILFTSAATYYWIRIFIEYDKSKKYLLAFIIFSILSAYTHYFALLHIAMLGGAAFIFSPTRLWWKIITAGFIVLLAFLPHYPITAFQMSVGGIGGWLGKPSDYFLVDVLFEFFDRSAFIIGMFVLVPMILIIIKPANPALKGTLLLAFLSLLPFSVLYFYSIKVNSVLQFSACFFLMPFLLGTFFSFFESKEKPPIILKTAYIILVLVFLTSTLYSNSAFKPTHFAEFKKIAQYIEEHESDSVTTVVAVNNPFYIDYYLKDKKPDLYITDMGDNVNFLKRYLDTCKTPEFIYAFANQRSNIEIPFIIKNSFYTCKAAGIYMNSEFYHFSNLFNKGNVDDPLFVPMKEQIFNSETKVFENCDENGGPFSEYFLQPNEEYSPVFESKLSELNLKPYNQIIASASFTGFERCDLELVISIENKHVPVFWRSRKLAYQYGLYDNFEKDSLVIQKGERFNTHRDLVIGETFQDSNIDLKEGILKVYIWNPNHCSGTVNRFTVRILKGNQWVTGYSQ